MIPSKVYHVLPEVEPFSEVAAGAISRVVANLIRDDARSVVVAPQGDDTWGFSPDRVVFVSRLAAYHDALVAIARLKLWVPPFLRLILLRQVFEPLVRRVQSGDIVWVHNRPEFVAALRMQLKRKDVRLVLHMHNTHLAYAKKLIIRKLDVDLIAFVSEFTKKQAEPILHKPTRLAVLHNGADPRLFFPRVDAFSKPLSAPPRIIFVGRLVPGKGAHVFIGRCGY